MTKWMIRIHMYTGLLSFTALALFGVVGIVATVLPPHAQVSFGVGSLIFVCFYWFVK